MRFLNTLYFFLFLLKLKQQCGDSPTKKTRRNRKAIRVGKLIKLIFMNHYLHVLRNYGNFSGRATRSEYWYFALFNIIFAIVAMTLDNVLGIAIESIGYGPIYIVYTILVLIPGIAVGVRRLHDVGKSGWFFFIILIPIVGAIWLLVLFVTESQQGENEYGPNPHLSENIAA